MPSHSRATHTPLMLIPSASPSSAPTVNPSPASVVPKFPHPLSIPSSLPSSTSSSPPQPQPPPQPPPHSLVHNQQPLLEATTSSTELRPPHVLPIHPNGPSVPAPPLSQASPTTPLPSIVPSPTAQQLKHPILGNGLTVDAIFLRAERVFEQRVETLLNAKRCKALQSGTAFNARKAKRDARTVAGREKLDALVRRLADLASAQHALLSKQSQGVASNALDGAAAAIIGIAALHAVPPSSPPSSSPSGHPQQNHNHNMPHQDVTANDGSSCSDDSVQGHISRQATDSGSDIPMESGRDCGNKIQRHLPHDVQQQMFPATQSVVDFVLDCEDEARYNSHRLNQRQRNHLPLTTASDGPNALIRNFDDTTNTSLNPPMRLGLGLDDRKRLISNYGGDQINCISGTNSSFSSKITSNVNNNNSQSTPLSPHTCVSSSQMAASPPPSNPSSSSLSSMASASSASASSSCASLSTSGLQSVMGTARPGGTQSAVSSATSKPHRSVPSHDVTFSQPLRAAVPNGVGFPHPPSLSSVGHPNGMMNGSFNHGPQKFASTYAQDVGLKKLADERCKGQLNYSSTLSTLPTGIENCGYVSGPCSHGLMSSSLGVNCTNPLGSFKYVHVQSMDLKENGTAEGNTMKHDQNNSADKGISKEFVVNSNTFVNSATNSPLYINGKGESRRTKSSQHGELKKLDDIDAFNVNENVSDGTISKDIANFTLSNIVQQQPQQQLPIAHNSVQNLINGAKLDNVSVKKLEIEGLSHSLLYSVPNTDRVLESTPIWHSQPSII